MNMINMTISNSRSNVFTIEDAIADAAAIGSQEGEASNMKHELMVRLATHAQSGAVSVDKTSMDVKRFAEAYFDGKKGSTFSATVQERSTKTLEKTVSQFRAVALCGAHISGCGVETLEKAVAIAASLRQRDEDFKKSLFQSVVDVAVVQKKSDRALTDAEIMAAVNPIKEEEAYSLAKRIEAITKTLDNLISGTMDPDGNVIKPAAKDTCPVASQRLESALSAARLALEAANKAEGRTGK